MSGLSDTELLEKFSKKDTRSSAFNEIVLKYQERLYWHVRRMVVDHDDANDVLQNSFLKAFRALDNFRAEANLYTWLYRIATNESISFINKKKRMVAVPMEDVEHTLSQNLESDVYYSGEDIQRKLQEAIATLPDKQRQVFVLKYFDELKYKEMSDTLQTSVGALKASYHHAVKKIEKFLTSD
jgi:RNA polymerase sigma factor (sigma-70 family)